MIAYYLADDFGDIEAEAETIQQQLAFENIVAEVQIADIKIFNKMFDVLFFDWGGMMPGSDMLWHLSRKILNDAVENPNRDYVMTSAITAFAIQDAKKVMGEDVTANIFFSVEDWIEIHASKLLPIYG